MTSTGPQFFSLMGRQESLDWGPGPVADLPPVKRNGFACDAAAVRLVLDSRKHITNPNRPLLHKHTTHSCRTIPKPLREIGEFLSSPWRSRGFFSASPSPPPCYCSLVSRPRLPASIYTFWCAPTQRSLIRSDLICALQARPRWRSLATWRSSRLALRYLAFSSSLSRNVRSLVLKFLSQLIFLVTFDHLPYSFCKKISYIFLLLFLFELIFWISWVFKHNLKS
jgi:hypothetical protein